MEPKTYVDMEVKAVGCITASSVKYVDVPFGTLNGKTVNLPTEVGTYYVPFTICDEYDTVECVVRSSSWQTISEMKKLVDNHCFGKKKIAQLAGELFGNADEGYVFAVSAIIPEIYSVS